MEAAAVGAPLLLELARVSQEDRSPFPSPPEPLPYAALVRPAQREAYRRRLAVVHVPSNPNVAEAGRVEVREIMAT